MSICVLVVFFRTCYNLCGVCKFVVGFTWLCMQMIDVSDGSTYCYRRFIAGSTLSNPK